MNERPSICTITVFSLALCMGVVLLLNVFFTYYDYSSALRFAKNQTCDAELGQIKEHQIKNLALRKVRFTLNMPGVEEVFLIADFSLWDSNKIKLKSQGKGVFSNLIVLPQGEYKYYFEADGKYVQDPSNTDCIEYNGKTVSLKTVI